MPPLQRLDRLRDPSQLQRFLELEGLEGLEGILLLFVIISRITVDSSTVNVVLFDWEWVAGSWTSPVLWTGSSDARLVTVEEAIEVERMVALVPIGHNTNNNLSTHFTAARWRYVTNDDDIVLFKLHLHGFSTVGDIFQASRDCAWRRPSGTAESRVLSGTPKAAYLQCLRRQANTSR